MDERRERYAAALRDSMGLAGIFADVTSQADAAMAIADAETADAYTVAAVIRKDLEAARDENARLRAELADTDTDRRIARVDLRYYKATIERVRAVADQHDGTCLSAGNFARFIRAALEGESA